MPLCSMTVCAQKDFIKKGIHVLKVSVVSTKPLDETFCAPLIMRMGGVKIFSFFICPESLLFVNCNSTENFDAENTHTYRGVARGGGHTVSNRGYPPDLSCRPPRLIF